MSSNIADLIKASGVTATDVIAFGHYPFDAGQLALFVKLIVAECASIQEMRSTQRHGFDKYDDAAAITSVFD